MHDKNGLLFFKIFSGKVNMHGLQSIYSILIKASQNVHFECRYLLLIFWNKKIILEKSGLYSG